MFYKKDFVMGNIVKYEDVYYYYYYENILHYTSRNILYENGNVRVLREVKEENAKYLEVMFFFSEVDMFVFNDEVSIKKSDNQYKEIEYFCTGVVSENEFFVTKMNFSLMKQTFNIYNDKLDLLKFSDWVLYDRKLIDSEELYWSFENKIYSKKWDFNFKHPNFSSSEKGKQPTTVEQFIGVYENEIWILLSNTRVLVLDKNTGKEVFHLESLREILGIGLDLSPTSNIHMDKKNGLIKFFAGLYFYIEVDIKKRKAQVKKDFRTDGRNFHAFSSWFRDGDSNLYFTATKGRGFCDIVGVFDTKKLEIVWYYKLPEESDSSFGAINIPKSNGNLLAITDSKKTLWVFDLEKINNIQTTT